MKSIHHFASCYYRERGQLFDSSRNFRGKKKERYKQSQENIHILAANTLEHRNSETEHSEAEDESTEDFAEEDEDDSELMEVEDSGRKEARTKADAYRKDMYKALDGSALMAIGPLTNLDLKADSSYYRYCATGICGTHTYIRTSFSRPKAEKNWIGDRDSFVEMVSYTDTRMRIYYAKFEMQNDMMIATGTSMMGVLTLCSCGQALKCIRLLGYHPPTASGHYPRKFQGSVHQIP